MSGNGLIYRGRSKRFVTTQVHGWRAMKIESRLAGKILMPGNWHVN